MTTTALLWVCLFISFMIAVFGKHGPVLKLIAAASLTAISFELGSLSCAAPSHTSLRATNSSGSA